MEEWRQIEGYENYSVSNLGNILNDKTGKILKGIMLYRGGGYLKVGLYDNNTCGKQILIHRLVATAFLPNPENLPQVDHIDRNSQNNKLENLRWITCSNNSRNTKNRNEKTSSYRGVSWDKSRNKWSSNITINRKHIFLGRFETEEEAYEAWRAYVFENNLQEFYSL
jgi:hypothetical protein